MTFAIPATLTTVAYIGAIILFIMSLGGLSNPETSRRGNWYGIIGMTIAILATVFGSRIINSIGQPIVALHGLPWIVGAMAAGGTIGLLAAKKVKMTQMPELVAIMHSLVGLAACTIGFASFIDTTPLDVSARDLVASENIHLIEIYIGILIGAVTFSGSVIAFGKLSGSITGKPVIIPGRNLINLLGLAVVIYYAYVFVQNGPVHAGTPSLDVMMPLIVMTGISLLFGIHMVMAIGGADMPVVVSMLNSYSGWAAAATGFMLGNDLLIVVGALVGSSGAILSYIMCRAMNRKFLAVISGGFGTGGGAVAKKKTGDEDVTVVDHHGEAEEIDEITARDDDRLAGDAARQLAERDHRAREGHGTDQDADIDLDQVNVLGGYQVLERNIERRGVDEAGKADGASCQTH